MACKQDFLRSGQFKRLIDRVEYSSCVNVKRMNETEFLCPYCWQVNTITIDITAGQKQTFTTDCEVCCRPIAITVNLDDDGQPMVDATAELSD